ncbi:MAG: SRPBCC family protein, partial [Hyphomicrobium sp.]
PLKDCRSRPAPHVERFCQSTGADVVLKALGWRRIGLDGAMQIVVQQIVHAPRALTFAIACDIGGWPDLMSGIEKIEMLTREPVVAGTRFRETRRMHGRVSAEEMAVAEINPPEHFVLTGESHGARYRIDHVFEDVPEGTRMTLMFAATPLTMSARLMSPLALMFRAALLRQIKADLDDVKTVIEARFARNDD